MGALAVWELKRVDGWIAVLYTNLVSKKVYHQGRIYEFWADDNMFLKWLAESPNWTPGDFIISEKTGRVYQFSTERGAG